MANGHRFHPTILREYDIRGIVGETLSAADARAIGRTFATLVRRSGGRRICVGRDGRLSSPELAEAVIGGVRAAGVDVVSLGLGPTPMMYFAVHELDTDGGIQVTGSHNPPSHNGFKMMLGKASFFGERIRELGRMAEAGDWETGEGRIEEVDVLDRYVDRLVRDYHGNRPLDVVWDAGNGAAGPAMALLARRLPGRHHCLFAEVDGRFPNHHPDPTEPHNLEALIAAVAARGAEVGIAFDGDGDRIGVVDGRGRIIWGDQLLMILAADLLARRPGATIIADVKASQTLFDEIARLGGRPLMWKTGHSLIKAKMVETGAPLSGEMSGHIFYKDGFYGHDDALYVAVRLLDILARGTRTLAELRDAMPATFSTPEVRFDCPEERKFAVVAELARALARDGAEVDTTDGVRVRTPDGWWLLRASNTQAVLVARAEATSAEGLERLKGELRTRLRSLGIEPPASF
ncbi:MAG: phosphomannomutase [Geminicoccaceae bacterium]|jgi:phosphomannomutase|nr:MAG: phosphomannomutase [Geminicoccaceae bacterium]